MYQLISVGNMYFKGWLEGQYPVWVINDMPGALDDAYRSKSVEQTKRILNELSELPIKVTTITAEKANKLGFIPAP